MTTVDTTTAPAIRPLAPTPIRARQAGFVQDVMSIAGRALRSIKREPEFVYPAIIVPVFFFAVNLGLLQDLTESQASGFDFKAFSLPIAIIFGVTGVTRAGVLVIDIQEGYFDRLLLTPIRRSAILLGMMIADIALCAALAVPVVALGFLVGVDFEAGVLGIVALIALAAAWGLAFTGFPYAIALKTGNPAAVNTSFMLFLPFAFLTTGYVPREAITGWMDKVVGWNPVTYILDGMRSLISVGWEWDVLAKAIVAIGVVGLISMSLCFAALRSRVRRG